MTSGLREDIHYTWSSAAVKRAAISLDLSGGGNGDIVAAVPGKRIRLLAIYFTASAASTFNFRGTAQALTGAMTTIAGQRYWMPFMPLGWVQTGTGERLNLLNGGTACNYRGCAVYAEVDP